MTMRIGTEGKKGFWRLSNYGESRRKPRNATHDENNMQPVLKGRAEWEKTKRFGDKKDIAGSGGVEQTRTDCNRLAVRRGTKGG